MDDFLSWKSLPSCTSYRASLRKWKCDLRTATTTPEQPRYLLVPMSKRLLDDEDDEVEIVSSSFDAPGFGPTVAGSSFNFDSPPKRKSRRPRAKQDARTFIPSTIAPPDPHPYSYPSKPAPSVPQNMATSSKAQPPAKKQRKKKADPDAPVPEKRGAMFKKACPKNILDRVDRVMSQRYAYTQP